MKPKHLALIAAALFALRTIYGFTYFASCDGIQVFLIGLKYFTTGLFPFWGADVVYTASQIPGSMQGLAVGLPLQLWPAAESPIIALNLLSFAGIALFAWYLGKRIPKVPNWFTWIWLLTAPWSLHYTHIENPSYVLPAAILFFIAIFELFPFYREKIVRPEIAFFSLGFCLTWIMQFHLSWVLTLPYIALAFYFNRKQKRQLSKGLMLFIAGAALPATALLPGLIRFGNISGGGVEQNIVLNPDNLKAVFTLASRFGSLACYEVAHFTGGHTSERIAFLQRHQWVWPFAMLAVLSGLVQFVYLVYAGFKKFRNPAWPAVRWFTLATFFLVYAAFSFSIAPPYSHAFLILYPVVMWYSFYCYAQIAHKRWFRPLAAIFLINGMCFQTALALDYNSQYGLKHYRAKIARAVRTHDYTFVGLRREAGFELQHTENPWVEITRDTAPLQQVFFTGYEYQNPWFKPQNIVGTAPFEGSFCCKIDSLQAFSRRFGIYTAEIDGAKTIRSDFELRFDHPHILSCVTEIKKGGKTVFWKGQTLDLSQARAGAWSHITVSTPLPDPLPEDAEVATYIWRPEAGRQETAYLDNISITFFKNNY